MINPTQVLTDSFGDHLANSYRIIFGGAEAHYAQEAAMAGRLVLECIANTDAAYHDLQHTLLVTAVGLEIMRGKHIRSRTKPEDWLQCTVV